MKTSSSEYMSIWDDRGPSSDYLWSSKSVKILQNLILFKSMANLGEFLKYFEFLILGEKNHLLQKLKYYVIKYCIYFVTFSSIFSYL